MPEYEYPRPAATVDLVVFTPPWKGVRKVLMIARKNEPFKHHWALPGGFVDKGENVRQAALRELQEETGLDAWKLYNELRLIDVFSEPGRDPRGWVISTAFALSWPTSGMDLIEAGDDAAAVVWMELNSRMLENTAFDHADIIRAAGLSPP